MSFSSTDLGVVGNLAKALGILRPSGDPNPDWFGSPETSLRTILEQDDQRNALIAFVDEAMGGADRTTDPTGVVWLPIVTLEDPDITFAITVDDAPPDGIHIGIGISVRTSEPRSNSSLSVPLFRAHKANGPAVTNALLLGSHGGRIRLATSITIDDAAPVPGTARLGAIGLDIDVPTTTDGTETPVFGLSLTGFQLPGATRPRDIRVAADGLDELDDAVLDLVLALVRAQANDAPADSPIAAIAGLLGLREGDDIPDFPITQLPTHGVHAIATWLQGVLTTTVSLNDWVGYLASLLDGTAEDDSVTFELGADTTLRLRVRVDTGPTGNARLTPMLSVELGTDPRVESRADLCQIDLVTGAAIALPQFGAWAAAGSPGAGNRVLDSTGPPVARADTLRVGFALDPERRLTFVLAADNVLLGERPYPTLDLTSPDALMDAAENTVGDIAEQLLDNCGEALGVIRLFLGLEPPTGSGITAVTLPALMANPITAVSAYWLELVTSPGGAMRSVLTVVRDTLADESGANLPVSGAGTALDPWLVPLIGPLRLEVAAKGAVLTVNTALATSVDTLGQRCTVVQTHLAATLAEIDLAAPSATLLPGV